MKKIFKISLWIIGLAAISALVGFIENEHQKTTCKSIEVLLDYHDADPLIDAVMIKANLGQSYDDLVGKRLSEIDQVAIEDLVSQNHYVKNAEVYATLNGHLKIKVTQKQPLLRIMNQKGENYYLDMEATLMPVKTGYSTRLLVATGNIKTAYTDTIGLINIENFPELHNLYKLALYVRNSEFLSAQIEQIYVTETGEYELIPKVGRQLIVFGDIAHMDQKFDNLIAFYQKGMKKAGWDTYKTINLKFSNQVVCTKK